LNSVFMLCVTHPGRWRKALPEDEVRRSLACKKVVGVGETIQTDRQLGRKKLDLSIRGRSCRACFLPARPRPLNFSSLPAPAPTFPTPPVLLLRQSFDSFSIYSFESSPSTSINMAPRPDPTGVPAESAASPIGIANLPNQRHKIVAKRGAAFTIMVCGLRPSRCHGAD
jgi:hypothetical protein